MGRLRIAFAVFFPLFTGGNVIAQGIPPVIAKNAKWELRKGSDSFSGKATCLMTLIANRRVQLSDDSLDVSYRNIGGLKGYRVRLDEGAPSAMTLPTGLEEQTNIISFSGARFHTIMQAKRLRIQTLTYLDLKDDDIDLASAAPLFARMRREC